MNKNPKTAKAKPKKQHPHNQQRQQAENYVHGSRGHQSQYMNEPISINSKAKFDRENKVRQANKVVMPCIEQYTKLAGQKRGKGSRVKSEEFSMHWWRFNGVRTLVVLYFFPTIFKVRFQKPFPGYSFFLVVGKHEDKRICNRDEPSPRGGQGSAPWQEGAERENRSLSWHIKRKAFPLSKGGDLGALRLMRGKVRWGVHWCPSSEKGACWAVNHGARWWRANAGAERG